MMRILAALSLFMLAAISTGQSGVFQGDTPVGTSSIAQTVSVTLPNGGSLSAVRVRTGGVDHFDFSISGAGDCAVPGTYSSGKICHFNVTFTPKYPGQRVGAIVLLDGSNVVLGSTALLGTGKGSLALFVPGTIKTVAGDASWIFHAGDDNQPATSSPIFLPFGIAVDGGGSLFIADNSNNRVRRVDSGSQMITTVAGNGNPGTSGNGGPATAASISQPSAVALDGAGNLYFADSGNHAIRKVDAFSGLISTIAGQLGITGSSGDGGQATAALLNSPSGVALDTNGNLYIADTLNHVIRKVNLSTGVISAFAGNYLAAYAGDNGPATSASLNSPWNVTISFAGDVYIADQNNHAVRKVDTGGRITTIAGNGTSGFSGDGGPGSLATLNNPSSVSVDVAGNIYIADTGNNRVRKINAVSGAIETVVGSGSESFSGDAGPADQAGVYGPYGTVLDGAGNLFVADVFHNRIRKISSDQTTIYYDPIRVRRVSAAQTKTLENDGNAPLHFSALQAISNAEVDSVTTTCSPTIPVNASLTCNIGAKFAPQVVGDPVIGNIQIASDSPNSPQSITLQGKVTELDPTTAVLGTSGSPAALGAPVTFTVTLSGSGVPPTGTTTFLDGTQSIGTATLDGNGVARLTIASLALGTHSITVSYPGDTNNAPSTSNVLTQVIKNGTVILLQSTNNPSSALASVTFTATAVGVNGTPTGMITFLDDTVAIGSGPLDGNGVATFSTTTLAVGTHHITARYGGDASALGNVSAALTQIVNKSSTLTSVSSSNANATFSTAVVFTATVTSQTAGVPTGDVAFVDGTMTLGTVPLNGSGIASLSLTNLAVGSHAITAQYIGDSNNQASNSALLQESVSKISSTTLLTSNSNPSAAGGVVHLQATVSGTLNPAGSPLTGSVLFTDGGATLGTGTVAGGMATLDVTALSIGQHTIVATFSGGTNYESSKSAPLSQQVQLATSTATLASSANPAVAGKPLTLSAGVTGTGGAPTGAVVFKDGTVSLGQGTLSASGLATLTNSTLSVGPHTFAASYAGDANNQPSTATLTLNVVQANTATVLSSSGTPSVVGLPLTLKAAVSGNGGTPSGSVTFFDGMVSLGAGQTDNTGLASLMTNSLSVGPHTISAIYAGDANDLTSTSPTFIQTIQKTTTVTALTSSSLTAPEGAPILFVTQVSSNAGVPGGTVQLLEGTRVLGEGTLSPAGIATVTISSLISGQHNITAAYMGDTNNGASSSSAVVELVTPITLIGLTSTLNPASTGAVVTFTAGVGGGHTIPTGLVTFFDGSAILGNVMLNTAGVATFSTSTLSTGVHPIKASYGGDASNAASVSTVYPQTIRTATTQTVLTLSSTMASLTSPVTLSAVVTGSGGIPTGNVTFSDGTTVLATKPLSAAGTVTYITTTLGTGAHPLTAVYEGDGNDGGSASAPQTLTVAKVATQITTVSSLTPSLGGVPVTFTAVLKVPSGTPTGNVTWSEGGTALATVPVSGTGTASYTTASLTPGQHSILATYLGDNTFDTVTSSALPQTVNVGTSATALVSLQPTALAGAPVTLSISVTGTGVQPRGTVTLFDGGIQVSVPLTLDANGLALFPTSTLSVGTHSLTVSYGGDLNHGPSQSVAVAELINPTTSAVVLSSNRNPATSGEMVMFSMAVTGPAGTQPGGSVKLMDGAVLLATLPLDGSGLATYSTAGLSVGLHNLIAAYAGDAIHQTSSSLTLPQAVGLASSITTLTADKSAVLSTDTVTFTVVVTETSGQPTGSVTILDGGAPFTTATPDGPGQWSFRGTGLAAGQHSFVAVYGGDASHTGSHSAALVEGVQQRTTATLLSSANPALIADTVTFTVKVTNGAGTALPSGSVSLTDGSATLGTTILDASGSASFQLAGLTAGRHNLLVIYAGDAQNFTSTSAPLVETVGLRNSLTVLAVSSGSISVGQPVLLTATLSGNGPVPPTGGIVFSSGGTILGTAVLGGPGLTGNTVSATSSVATLSVTPLAGTYNVVATYQGDSIYAGSTSATQPVSVDVPANFTVTLNPSTMTLASKQHSTIQITLTSYQSFTDMLALGCVGLPQAATCTFSTDHSKLDANGKQVIDLTIDTGSPLIAGGAAKASNQGMPSKTTLCLLPGGMGLLFLLFRMRGRTRMLSGLLAMMIVAMSYTVVGCGGLQVNGTPAGGYTFNVTAIGAKTAVTQFAPMTLTVTP